MTTFQASLTASREQVIARWEEELAMGLKRIFVKGIDQAAQRLANRKGLVAAAAQGGDAGSTDPSQQQDQGQAAENIGPDPTQNPGQVNWANNLSDLFDKTDQLNDIAEHLEQKEDAIVRQLINQTGKDLGLSFDVRNELAQGVIAQRPKQFANIADTQANLIYKLLEEAWEKGMSISDAAAYLQKRGSIMSLLRGRTIARTELTGLTNAAGLHMAMLTESFPYKVWTTAGGARYPRHDVDDFINGQTVPVRSPFTIHGVHAMYPGDPNLAPEDSVNCRCTLTYADHLPDAKSTMREDASTYQDPETWTWSQLDYGRPAFDPQYQGHGPSYGSIKDWEGTNVEGLAISSTLAKEDAAAVEAAYSNEVRGVVNGKVWPPKVRYLLGDDPDTHGGYWSETQEIGINRDLLSRGKGWVDLSFSHEYGHHVWFSVFQKGPNIAVKTPEIERFFRAIRATPEFAEWKATKGPMGRYIRSREEIWGRAFGQWSVTKAGNRAAMNVAARRYAEGYFSEETIRKLGPYIDDILKTEGVAA